MSDEQVLTLLFMLSCNFSYIAWITWRMYEIQVKMLKHIASIDFYAQEEYDIKIAERFS